MATRGFIGRRRSQSSKSIPPGQYVVQDFPVLSAGPTPRTPLDQWSFTLQYESETLAEWNWTDFVALPQTKITVDIHCVTKWSKLDTTWEGFSVDTLLEIAGFDPPTDYVMAYCDGDYMTNLPLEDLMDGKGMVGLRYEGEALPAEHGGPARLFVPHLYFWKSEKWIRGLRFMDSDEPGFWEGYGYHIYGDPWREQRYAGD